MPLFKKKHLQPLDLKAMMDAVKLKKHVLHITPATN